LKGENTTFVLMTYGTIIVAGGIGSRMNSDLPKQFMEINSKPVIVHTIEKFLSLNQNLQLVVVMHPEWVDYWIDVKNKWLSDVGVLLALGGDTRFNSVKNGLELINTDLVAVHDAARPLVSLDVIRMAYNSARLNKAVIPVIAVSSSLRKIAKNSSKHVNRADYKVVQTPQVFATQLIKEAYKTEFQTHFTDDASVVENLGQEITLVDGNEENIKITTQIDLTIAKYLL